jgi:hypothetical protein
MSILHYDSNQLFLLYSMGISNLTRWSSKCADAYLSYNCRYISGGIYNCSAVCLSSSNGNEFKLFYFVLVMMMICLCIFVPLNPQFYQFKKVKPEMNSKKCAFSQFKLTMETANNNFCIFCLSDLQIGEDIAEIACPAAHRFHSECIIPWVEEKSHCPLCNYYISVVD